MFPSTRLLHIPPLPIALCIVAALALASCNRSSSGSGQATVASIVINEIVVRADASDLLDGELDSAAGAILLDEKGRQILDGQGDNADWVEIYNASTVSVSLAGYSLTDDVSRPTRYRFPDRLVLPAGGFAVVICDGEEDRGPMHADFGLRSGGDRVSLFAGGELIDQLVYGDPDASDDDPPPPPPPPGEEAPIERVPRNAAIGRFPDGAGEDASAFDFIYVPTPGAPNRLQQIRGPFFDEAPLVRVGDDGLVVDLRVTDDDIEMLGFEAIAEAAGAAFCRDLVEVEFSGPAIDAVEDVARSFVTPTRRPTSSFEFIDALERSRFLTVEVPWSAIADSFADGFVQLRIAMTNAAGTRGHFIRCVNLDPPPLVVNEYLPRNPDLSPVTIFDRLSPDGTLTEFLDPDWLEIYNYGDEPLDLSGFRIAGQGGYEIIERIESGEICDCDTTELEAETLDCTIVFCFETAGLTEIAPGERLLLVAASEGPPYENAYFLHGTSEPVLRSLPFGISGSGRDFLAIYDTDFALVDLAALDFRQEPAETGFSYGRLPDGRVDVGKPHEQLTPENLDPDPGETAVYTLLCPTPLESNATECPDIAPLFDRRVWIDPLAGAATDSGWRFVTPEQQPRVFAFVNVDDDTVDELDFEVDYHFSVDGGPETTRPIPFTSMQPVDPGSLNARCFSPRIIPGGRAIQVLARMPALPEGSLVRFRFEVRDLRLGLEDEISESEDPVARELEVTSFRYFVSSTTPPVFLNEVLPQNGSVLTELYPDVEPGAEPPGFALPDYVELFNAGDAPVDLSGFYLADARDRSDGGLPYIPAPIEDVREYRIPDTTVLDPGEFLVVLFTSTERLNTDPQLEGSSIEGRALVVEDVFQLNNCEETLFLLSSEELGIRELSSISWDFRGGDVNDCVVTVPDRVIGRLPDGSEELFEIEPSPGFANAP